jgi:hypothetical protein
MTGAFAMNARMLSEVVVMYMFLPRGNIIIFPLTTKKNLFSNNKDYERWLVARH